MCSECRSLRDSWQQHLENSGFQDHEKNGYLKVTINSHETAKDWHDETLFNARVNYYQWARSKLNDARFTSERDRLIWEYHTEGLSSRQIAPRVSLDQSGIVRTVNRIKQAFNQAIGSLSMVQGIA
jgi:hypothetical protein